MSDIGTEIRYTDGKGKDVKGKLVDKRKGNPLTNIKTNETDNDTVQLKIKPNDGSRAFWTRSMSKV